MSNKRTVCFIPFYMENLQADIFIDGDLYVNQDHMNSKSLYEIYVPSDFNGYKTIEIKVKSGSLSFDERSSKVIYELVYDKFSGYSYQDQSNFVSWYSIIESNVDTNNSSVVLKSGDSIRFHHLIPNGPNRLMLYINDDKTKDYFIENRILERESDCVIRPVFDYTPIDLMVDKNTRTENLLKEIK